MNPWWSQGYWPIPSMYGIHLNLVDFFMVNVGKYTSPMDGMGWVYSMQVVVSLTPTPPPRPISPKWWFSKGNPQTNQGNLRLVKYYSVWPDTTEPDFHGKIVSSLNIHSRLVWVRYDWTTKKTWFPSKRRQKTSGGMTGCRLGIKQPWVFFWAQPCFPNVWEQFLARPMPCHLSMSQFSLRFNRQIACFQNLSDQNACYFQYMFFRIFSIQMSKKIQTPQKDQRRFFTNPTWESCLFVGLKLQNPFRNFKTKQKSSKNTIIDVYSNSTLQETITGHPPIPGTGKSSTPKVLNRYMGYGFVSKRVLGWPLYLVTELKTLYK